MLTRALRAPWWWQMALAMGSGAAASGLTVLLRLEDGAFILPMFAVGVVALRGGMAAGMLCAGVTLLMYEYLVAAPRGGGTLAAIGDAYEMWAFAIAATFISAIAARRRRAQLTLEATVASIGDGVIVTDDEGRVQFLNTVAERLTGWPLKDALGQMVTHVFVASDDATRELVLTPVFRALDQGTTVGAEQRAVLSTREGAEIPIAHSAAPIKDPNGRTLGAVLVFRDASVEQAAQLSLLQQAQERQVLLERERDARAEAERANRLKDEFLATLSHELRTPLNAVLGWAHMLTRRQLTSEQQKQALAAIHRNAQAQARLVEDVLDLSRIVTGRMAMTSEPVDVSEIVRTTADAFTPTVAARRQSLRLELAAGAAVNGDPHRLRQILWNLLSNATKFTPEGGTITVAVAVLAGRVEVSVSDTGQGIDPAFLPFVFDRFRQADSSSTRGHGGLGLGLALVKHLVEAHGGTVRAFSEGVGRGATIQFALPARAPDDPGVGVQDRLFAV